METDELAFQPAARFGPIMDEVHDRLVERCAPPGGLADGALPGCLPPSSARPHTCGTHARPSHLAHDADFPSVTALAVVCAHDV